jgi:RNA polymerase sigma factor (sigma-70 family)
VPARHAQTGRPAGAAPDAAGDRDAAAPDAVLAARVAAADQDALGVLYERHHLACYRLARHVTASHALAEDAVQEAFAALWQTAGRYQPGRGSVRTWLLSLAHHRAVDLVRREAAEQRRQAASAAEQAARPPAEDDPAAVTWEHLRAASVRAALGDLPEVQRQAVTLAYFGGYTQSQIAELTGAPLGTVKFRMFTAMRRLRHALHPLAAAAGDGPA